MKIGDILGFSDSSLISEVIENVTGTKAIAHVAIVADVFKDDCLIIESTHFEKVAHVGSILLSKRKEEYKKNKGNIFLLELNKKNRAIMEEKEDLFKKVLYSQLNKSYDKLGAIKAGLDFADNIGITKNKEDAEKLFCSELIALVYESLGILPESSNFSEITPIELCQLKLWKKQTQLLGNNLEIENFNNIKV